MKRHRWVPASDKPKRHHGRCEECGLIRIRAPGSHVTFFEWTTAKGEVEHFDRQGTPTCPPSVETNEREPRSA